MKKTNIDKRRGPNYVRNAYRKVTRETKQLFRCGREPWTKLATVNAIIGSLPMGYAAFGRIEEIRKGLLKLEHVTLREVYHAVAGPESAKERRAFERSFYLVK